MASYRYGSIYRPFWLSFGSHLLTELGEGAEVEYEEPQKPYLGIVRTNRPIPARLVASWELTELEE